MRGGAGLSRSSRCCGQGKSALALLLVAIAFGFIVNMAFVIVSRTALVTMPVMLAVFALLHLKWRSIVDDLVRGGRASPRWPGRRRRSCADHGDVHPGLPALQGTEHADIDRVAARILARSRCGFLPRRRSSATARDRREGCSSRPPRATPISASGAGDRQSAQPDAERRGAVGHCRRRRAVCDVAVASAAVPRRRARRPGSDCWWWCRISSLRCSTRICSIFTRAGCMCWASASPAAWCCEPDPATRSGNLRNCPVMIAGMHAADEISADAGISSRIPCFRSRPVE